MQTYMESAFSNLVGPIDYFPVVYKHFLSGKSVLNIHVLC